MGICFFSIRLITKRISLTMIFNFITYCESYKVDVLKVWMDKNRTNIFGFIYIINIIDKFFDPSLSFFHLGLSKKYLGYD